MANFVAQMKERLRSNYGLASSHNEKAVLSDASAIISQAADFLLDCSIQALKGLGDTGLSSRVSYYFPSKVPASLNDVFRYVDELNALLLHSKVFVVQDLDGDRSYYLRMDTVLLGSINASSISALLDNIAQDVSILLQYFRYNSIVKKNAKGTAIGAFKVSKRNALRKCG